MSSDVVYLPVSIDDFRNAGRDISFDLYLKVSTDNYIHLFSRVSGLDYKRLAQYVSKGVHELYIRSDDQPSYVEYISNKQPSLLSDPSVPNEKKLALLLNMTEQAMTEIFETLNVSEGAAESTKIVVRNYVDLMSQSPKTLALLLKLVTHGDYLYYHSISVAIFSMFMAKATGQFDQKGLENIGMGAFLHDIGLTQLPKSLMTSNGKYTDSEWALMKSHPKVGLQMIEHTPNIPEEVRFIIYQHHEEPSGQGYPNRLQNTAIYYPAKLVAVSDAFAALISNRPYRKAHTVEEALKILNSEKGKHDTDLVQLIARIFMPSAEIKKAG